MESFKPNTTLLGERIILTQREEAHDLDVWEAICECRKELREYLFWVDKTNDYTDVVKATQAFYKHWENNYSWCYNIYDLQTHSLIGCIDAHNISFANQSAELGYWLRTSKTKKGYMTEAIHILEKELFEQGLHRIIICCDVHNTNSSKTAQRAGYYLEGVAKEAIYHYEGLHDLEIYVKLSPYPIIGFK